MTLDRMRLGWNEHSGFTIRLCERAFVRDLTLRKRSQAAGAQTLNQLSARALCPAPANVVNTILPTVNSSSEKGDRLPFLFRVKVYFPLGRRFPHCHSKE